MWFLNDSTKANPIVPAYNTAEFNTKEYSTQNTFDAGYIAATLPNLYTCNLLIEALPLSSIEHTDKIRCVNFQITSLKANDSIVPSYNIFNFITNIDSLVYLDNNYTLTTNFPYRLAIFNLEAIDSIAIEYIITYGLFYSKDSALKFTYGLSNAELSKTEAGSYVKVSTNVLTDNFNYPCYIRCKDTLIYTNDVLTTGRSVLKANIKFNTLTVGIPNTLEYSYLIYQGKSLTPVLDIFDYLDRAEENIYYKEANRILCLAN